jgi:hypothetical protein
LYRSEAAIRTLAIVGCLLAILGAKIWLIAAYAVEMPYLDQWIGEAQSIYLPYLKGTLTLSDFFALHFEHRIVFTRALALALLILNGSWDPILGMLVNALVHLAVIALILMVARPRLGLGDFLLFTAFVLLIFAVPLGWNNTLWAFQLQFYALPLLSALSLICLYDAAAWTVRWWLGTAFALAAYLAMASGALTLPALLALAALQFVLGQRRGRSEASGLLALAPLSIALLLAVPHPSPPDSVRGDLLTQLYSSLAAAAAWPIATSSWPLALRWIGAALMFAPSIWLTLHLVARRAPVSDRNWLFVAFACWAGTQVAAIAFARAGYVAVTRYADIFLLAVLINFACLLKWLRAPDSETSARAKQAIAALWLLALFLGAGQKALDSGPQQMRWMHDAQVTQAESLKHFLQTGDDSLLMKLRNPQVVDPYPEILRDVSSDPLIQSILPPELMGKPQPQRPRDAVLSGGPMLLPLGAGLFFLAIWRALLRRPEDRAAA